MSTPYGTEYDRLLSIRDAHLAAVEAGFAGYRAAVASDWVPLLEVLAAMKRFRFSAAEGPHYDRPPATAGAGGGVAPLVATAQDTERRLQAIRSAQMVFPEPPIAHYGLPVEPGDLT